MMVVYELFLCAREHGLMHDLIFSSNFPLHVKKLGTIIIIIQKSREINN